MPCSDQDLIDHITDLSSEVPLDFHSSRVQVLSGHKYTLRIKVVRSPSSTSLYSLDSEKKANSGEVLNRDDFKHISDIDVVTRDQKRYQIEFQTFITITRGPWTATPAFTKAEEMHSEDSSVFPNLCGHCYCLFG